MKEAGPMFHVSSRRIKKLYTDLKRNLTKTVFLFFGEIK